MSQMRETVDLFVWLVGKVSDGTATPEQQDGLAHCSAQAILLQEQVDKLRDQLKQYLLLIDNDYARLGLTESKSEILRDFMLATSVRPFAPLIKLYEKLGNPVIPLTPDSSQPPKGDNR